MLSSTEEVAKARAAQHELVTHDGHVTIQEKPCVAKTQAAQHEQVTYDGDAII
jgi:hypothetical protein